MDFDFNCVYFSDPLLRKIVNIDKLKIYRKFYGPLKLPTRYPTLPALQRRYCWFNHHSESLERGASGKGMKFQKQPCENPLSFPLSIVEEELSCPKMSQGSPCFSDVHLGSYPDVAKSSANSATGVCCAEADSSLSAAEALTWKSV